MNRKAAGFNMAKPIMKVHSARIVPAETIWPGRCNPEDQVLLATLLDEHPVLGAPRGGAEPIRTSLLVKVDFIARTVETRNSIYQIVERPQ